MTARIRIVFAASALALAAAGCASGGDRADLGRDPYAAAVYTGAPQPDIVDQYSGFLAPVQRSQNGATLEVVSYAGIEGARRAHERYTEEEAEALDGRCEQRVKATATESLIDIASLCDVPLEKLVAYNPDIANVSYAASGAYIDIPGGLAAPRGAFAMSDALASLYTVEEGDSLEKIADKVGLTPAALANLNPGVFWPTITPGQAIRKEAAAPVAATSAADYAYVPAGPTPAWEGYSSIVGSHGAGVSSVGIAHAPYQLGMVRSYAKAKGVYPAAQLEVDKDFVKPGEKVRVTAQDLTPGTTVRFSGAGNKSVTAIVNENREATAEMRVGKKASIGGVIFEARPEGADETLFSKRVGVVTLTGKSDAKKDNQGGGGEDAE